MKTQRIFYKGEIKRNLSKITVVTFVFNSLAIAGTDIVNSWHYLHFNDTQWIKALHTIFLRELIYSPFGFYKSDVLTIATSLVLLILALRSLKYDEDHAASLASAFCIVLVMYEVTKLLVCIAFCGGINNSL